MKVILALAMVMVGFIGSVGRAGSEAAVAMAAPTVSSSAPASSAMQMEMSGAQASASDYAIHGMVVFGRSSFGDGALFLSHMPMFHAPHDEQAIFEAKLDPAGLEAYASAGSGLVTMVPEPMSLIELIAHPHAFKADLYDGHFERGGVKIASGITVTITSVVHAHKLGEDGPATISFVKGCWHYSAHFIKKAPDYDEITAYELSRSPNPPVPVVIYHEDADLAQ